MKTFDRSISTCTCDKLHTVTLYLWKLIIELSPQLCRSKEAHKYLNEGMKAYPLFKMYTREVR